MANTKAQFNLLDVTNLVVLVQLYAYQHREYLPEVLYQRASDANKRSVENALRLFLMNQEDQLAETLYVGNQQGRQDHFRRHGKIFKLIYGMLLSPALPRIADKLNTIVNTLDDQDLETLQAILDQPIREEEYLPYMIGDPQYETSLERHNFVDLRLLLKDADLAIHALENTSSEEKRDAIRAAFLKNNFREKELGFRGQILQGAYGFELDTYYNNNFKELCDDHGEIIFTDARRENVDRFLRILSDCPLSRELGTFQEETITVKQAVQFWSWLAQSEVVYTVGITGSRQDESEHMLHLLKRVGEDAKEKGLDVDLLNYDISATRISHFLRQEPGFGIDVFDHWQMIFKCIGDSDLRKMVGLPDMQFLLSAVRDGLQLPENNPYQPNIAERWSEIVMATVAVMGKADYVPTLRISKKVRQQLTELAEELMEAHYALLADVSLLDEFGVGDRMVKESCLDIFEKHQESLVQAEEICVQIAKMPAPSAPDAAFGIKMILNLLKTRHIDEEMAEMMYGSMEERNNTLAS